MLINDINELQLFVNVNVSLDFDAVSKHVKRIELDVIRKSISAAALNRFNQYLASIDSGSGSASGSSAESTFEEALDLLRYAEANLAMMLWSQVGSVQISSAGIRRAESEQQKTAYQYQEINVRESLKQSGFNYLDAALAVMDANTDIFTEFAESAEFANYRGSIIYKVADFQQCYNIGSSYLLFSKLLSIMNAIEDFQIIPAIGMALYLKVKAEVLKIKDLDNDLQALIPYLRKTIAHYAITELLYQQGDLTDKGLVFEGLEATSGNSIKQTQLSMAALENRIRQAQTYSLSYMEQLKGYLAANPTKYPDYVTHVGDGDNTLNIETTNNKIIVV